MKNCEKYIDEIVGSIRLLSELKEEGKFCIGLNDNCKNSKFLLIDLNINDSVKNLKKFLLEEAEEQSETYILNKMEYDLLEFFYKQADFQDVFVLQIMKSKGYFKNIKIDEYITIKEILENCIVKGDVLHG